VNGLALRGIERQFGDGAGLVHVDLDVQRGELVALIGPSGAGKSTLLRIVAGIEAPTRGTIHWGGHDITRSSPADRRVGMTFDDGALYEHLSVRKNLEAGLDRFGFRGDDTRHAACEAAELVGAAHLLDRAPVTLSAGERRRVALGRAIARRPQMLLLDEPLTHLDDRTRRDLREDVARAHRAIGAATIIVTHDHDDALAIADRLLFLDAGRVLQTGTATELDDAQHVAVARGCSWRALNIIQNGAWTMAFAPAAVRRGPLTAGSGWSGHGVVTHLAPTSRSHATAQLADGQRIRFPVGHSAPSTNQPVELHVPADHIQWFASDGLRHPGPEGGAASAIPRL